MGHVMMDIGKIISSPAMGDLSHHKATFTKVNGNQVKLTVKGLKYIIIIVGMKDNLSMELYKEMVP